LYHTVKTPTQDLIVPSISAARAEVLFILHELVVQRNVLLLRPKEAGLVRIKSVHAIAVFLCLCLELLYESQRRWRELRDRPMFDGGIVDEESPMEVITINDLVGETAEEFLALRPRKSMWVVCAESSEAPVDFPLGKARPTNAHYAPVVIAIWVATPRPAARLLSLAVWRPARLIVAIEYIVALGHPH
jgi:hypothetical protein